MLNKVINNEALGVIFPNSYDGLVPELVKERLMASIPFASRYRMVDFVISSMARAGIDNISLIARENYLSLMDHLGSGREWDLARKNGGLNIIPPFAQKNVKVYNDDETYTVFRRNIDWGGNIIIKTIEKKLI